MTTPIAVRTARPPDYAAVGDLTAGVYRAEGWGSESYQAELRDVAGRAAHAEVLVAESDGALVGAVAVTTTTGPFAEQAAPGEAVVRMLVTTAQARGRGVGAALMQACLAVARRDGCHLVRLSTQPQMHEAHRLYRRLGFVRTPAEDWWPTPDLLLLTYALPLLPAAGPVELAG